MSVCLHRREWRVHFYREDRMSGRRVKLPSAFSLLSIDPSSTPLTKPLPFSIAYRPISSISSVSLSINGNPFHQSSWDFHLTLLTIGKGVSLFYHLQKLERRERWFHWMLHSFPTSGQIVQLTSKLFGLDVSSLNYILDYEVQRRVGRRKSVVWCL